MKLKGKTICLKDKILQQYIDQELDEASIENVKLHISNCKECKIRFEKQMEITNKLKTGLPFIAENQIKIPEFKTVDKIRILYPKKRKVYFWWAAASVLLVVSIFIVNPFKDSIPKDMNYIFYDMYSEIDANKPWHDQSTTMYIVDESGEVIDQVVLN